MSFGVPVRNGVSVGIGSAASVGLRPFSPAYLFSTGAQGVWFDASDLSTMFQDDAGTVPVTAAGQVVGKWLDKSGNNNHATQATAGNKPVLRQDGAGRYYLEFDGATNNRWLQTGSVDFTATDNVIVCAGVYKNSTTAGVVIELGANVTTTNSTFAIGAPITTSERDGMYSRGTAVSSCLSATAQPRLEVITGIADISSDVNLFRRNGTQAQTSATDQGTGNYGNLPLFIGRRNGASFPFSGFIYGIIVKAGQSANINEIESYMRQKTGI